MSASTDITPGFGSVNACVRAKEPHVAAGEMFKDRLKGYFKVWDGFLAKRKYAAGDELTIADLSLYAGYWRTKGAFPELVAGMSNLERWGAEIGARPGVQRALSRPDNVRNYLGMARQRGLGTFGTLVVLAIAVVAGYYAYKYVLEPDAVSAASCKSQLNSCMVNCRKGTSEAPQAQACQEECSRKAAACTEPKR